MWYFSWILGVLLACAFGIINVMWYEFHEMDFDTDTNDLERLTLVFGSTNFPVTPKLKKSGSRIMPNGEATIPNRALKA